MNSRKVTCTYRALSVGLLAAVFVGPLWGQQAPYDDLLMSSARGYGVLSDDEALLKRVGSMILLRLTNSQSLSSLPSWVEDLKETKPGWIELLRWQPWPEGRTFSMTERYAINSAISYGIRSTSPAVLHAIGLMILFRNLHELPYSTLPSWVDELTE